MPSSLGSGTGTMYYPNPPLTGPGHSLGVPDRQNKTSNDLFFAKQSKFKQKITIFYKIITEISTVQRNRRLLSDEIFFESNIHHQMIRI